MKKVAARGPVVHKTNSQSVHFAPCWLLGNQPAAKKQQKTHRQVKNNKHERRPVRLGSSVCALACTPATVTTPHDPSAVIRPLIPLPRLPLPHTPQGHHSTFETAPVKMPCSGLQRHTPRTMNTREYVFLGTLCVESDESSRFAPPAACQSLPIIIHTSHPPSFPGPSR
jgi:hypothetical protein